METLKGVFRNGVRWEASIEFLGLQIAEEGNKMILRGHLCLEAVEIGECRTILHEDIQFGENAPRILGEFLQEGWGYEEEGGKFRCGSFTLSGFNQEMLKREAITIINSRIEIINFFIELRDRMTGGYSYEYLKWVQ